MSKKTEQKCSGGNTAPVATKNRNYCFTSYNLNPPIFNEKLMKYLAYGEETCPTTKRKHWQGFVCWTSPKTLSATIKKLKNGTDDKACHVEVIHGTLKQNKEYCSKEGKYKEFGDIPNQGNRKDLKEISIEIKNGKSVEKIRTEDPILYHQYGRTLDKLEDDFNKHKFRTEMTTCDWLYGKTGVGKSHLAFKNYSPNTHYIWKDDKGWWDGYDGQEIIIINEFRGQIQYCELLELIDKWPCTVRRRNRQPRQFIAKHIIITSSMHPKEIYTHQLEKNDSINQLLRRINIIHLTDIRLKH